MAQHANQLYLTDILEAIRAIYGFTKGVSFDDFTAQTEVGDLLRSAVYRKFEIIGEAARSLSEEARKQKESIPWQQVISMRNRLIHEYFGVEESVVWDTISDGLPELEKAVTDLLAQYAQSRN